MKRIGQVLQIITGGVLVFVFVTVLSLSPAMSTEPTPDFYPREGEFYPTQNENYPQKMPNPSAHTRVIPFEGKPLDIFTQINMVTQIVLPSPPLLVNIGRPEGFTVETIPEFNSIFIKPITEVEMTNLIVTCEKGVYLFIIKENPYQPWDIRVQVTDPQRLMRATDSYTLVWTAYHGKRPAEFQFVPMEIRRPNTSAYAHDPLIGLSARITLKSAVTIPREKKSVYWIEVANVAPPGADESIPAATYSVDERGVWMSGLERVAVPNPGNEPLPLLGRGDTINMFLIARHGQMPQMLDFRLTLHGSRNTPIRVTLPTFSDGNVISTPSTVDEKLQKMYNDMIQKKKNQDMTQPDVGNNTPSASGKLEALPAQGGGEGALLFPDPD